VTDRPPPLTPDARAVVDAARGTDDPDAGDRARVRARVLAAVAAGGAAGLAGEKAAASAGNGATGALAAKLGLLAIAIAGVATGAYLALRSPSSGGGAAPPPVTTLPPPPAEVDTAPATPAMPATIEIAPEDVPDHHARPVRRREPELSPADSLRAERALIARANDALRGGDARGALAAVAEHQRRFPSGLLVEERSAARVLALCAAGRTTDGASAREAFLATWPRSVHAAKVRSACAE